MLDPFFSGIAQNVTVASNKQSLLAIVANMQRDPKIELAMVRELWEHRVNGLILAGGGFDQMTHKDELADLVRQLTRAGIVVVSLSDRGIAAPVFSVDNEAVGAMLAEWAIENGHQKIGIAAGPANSFVTQQRLKGANRILKKAGIEPIVVHTEFGVSGGVALVEQLFKKNARDNPIWGIRRIAAELHKLGFKVSATTVSNYLPRYKVPPSPGWRAFLANHTREIAAVDFLVVVTVSFHLLYAMVVISHGRRRIVHVDVTENPTQDWAADQIARAFSSNRKPKYLIRDRDAIYGGRFRARLKELLIKEKVTAKQSPLQNIHVERTILSIRRECLDHVIVVNERHLRQLLTSYVQYYNYSRTHRALGDDCPVHRPVERPSRGAKIVAIPLVGGLHHRYERRAA